MPRFPFGLVMACAAAALVVRQATGQSLAARVAAVGDGQAQMRFAARAGVCGDGRGMIGTGRDSYIGQGGSYSDAGDDWHTRCVAGPVRVVLTITAGVVRRVRIYVGGADSSDGVHDLGVVSPRDATGYLLALARRATRGVGDEAVTASVLADSVTVWPALITMARDSSVSRGTRESATFWLSRAAAAARNGTVLFADDERRLATGDEDVRAQAIFALSQQPRREGVEPLIDVVRTNHDPVLRSKALFWLGQSGDGRAIDLFAEILEGAKLN